MSAAGIGATRNGATAPPGAWNSTAILAASRPWL